MGGPEADDANGGSDDGGGSSTSLSGTRGPDIGESRSSSVQTQRIISHVSMYSLAAGRISSINNTQTENNNEINFNLTKSDSNLSFYYNCL